MNGCKPLGDTEVSQVCEYLEPRDRALFLTGIRTGFRISELLALKIQDVWDGTQVRDAIAVRSRSMKGNAPTRCVALHAAAKQAIADYLGERGECSPCASERGDEPLFLSRKGGALDRKSAWRILHSAYLKAGVSGVEGQLGTHTMRKTFAKRMKEKLGPDLVKLQRALGHKSILSTAHYVPVDEEEITRAVLSA